MTTTKINVGSFATAKLQAISRRLIAIIALVAIIGFSFAACDGNGGGNGNGNDNGNGGGGVVSNKGWPSGSLLSKHGLSGLSAPSGATDISWIEMGPIDDFTSTLMIVFVAPSAADSTVSNWFTNNWGPSLGTMSTADGLTLRSYKKTGFVVRFESHSNSFYRIYASAGVRDD